MDILIPLGTGSEWKNNELKYCLRSLNQNLKGEYEIHVYGKEVPDWLTNVNIYPNIERYYPQWLAEVNNGKLNYENFFDTLNKVKVYASENDGTFLYCYDDVLLIKELNINDIQNVPLEIEYPKNYSIRNFDKHGRTINAAIDLFDNSGKLFPKVVLYNYETHIPRQYNCTNLRVFFRRFDFTEMKIPYALATAYFNFYPKEAYMNTSIIKDIKAGFYFDDESIASYMSNSLINIEQAIKGKTWINYNDKGLNVTATDGSGKQYLKEWIMNKFSKKSKYEL
jgi:hypothetical protein